MLRQAGLRLVIGRQRVDDVLQPLPRVAAVLGAEEAGADAAVGARAVVALVVPHRRVDDLRVGRVDATSIAPVVGVVGASTSCQVLPPSIGAVEAALLGRAGDVARRPRRTRVASWTGRPRSARSPRSSRRPTFGPVRAVVGGLVDAVAEVGQAAAGRVGLARAGPQRAVGRLRERAHRLDIRVGPDRRPVRAAVRGLPDAAAGDRRERRVGREAVGDARRSRARRCCTGRAAARRAPSPPARPRPPAPGRAATCASVTSRWSSA